MPPRLVFAPLFLAGLCLALIAGPAQAMIDSFFDVFTEVSTVPPYPSQPPAGANILPGGPLAAPVAAVSLRLNYASPPVPGRIQASDSGGGPGNAGLSSFFDVYLENLMMPSSFFDIFVEMSLPGGAPLVFSNAPTVIWHADSFFDVFLETEIPGLGPQTLRLEFRTNPSQPVRFNPNPTVNFAGPSSFFDVFLETVNTGGMIDPLQPLFRVVMTGTLGWPQPWAVPANVIKFRQNPDPTPRGLDVLDTWLTNNGPATLLADDFICTRTGPVTDIHLWGSWLNDLVDYWPTFWVGIWSDVPATSTNHSQPGQLLWWQQFSPGQYRASVQQSVPFELFLDPNTPPRILGQDRQIWKYDFFPRTPFRQLGSPQLPRIYWLSVVTKTAPGRTFGWKTTRDHFNDFAVYAPTILTFGPGYPVPQPPWKVITDPQGRKRELSFMLTTSQRWACNKDFWNPWPQPFHNVRVILPHTWGISSSFGGFGGLQPQFNTFGWDWNATGQTVMDWSDGMVPAGQWVHIGFEGPGEFPPFLHWGWWNPYVGNWWGWLPQVSIGWQPLLQPVPHIGFTNILPIVPGLSNNVFLSSLTIEYHTNEVALEALNRSTIRNPVRVDSIPVPMPMLAPGADVQLSVPPRPPEATHAVVIPQVSPVSEQGVPNPQLASVDWAMIPLTQELPPELPPAPVLLTPQKAGAEITLTWTAQPGGLYRVQSKASLQEGDWVDEEGDVIAADAAASKVLPVGASQSFYRVLAVLP